MIRLFLCLILTFGFQTIIANPITIESGKDYYTTGFHLKYFEDKNAELNWKDLEKPEVQNKFQESKQDFLGFGFTKSIFWVMIPYQANTDLADFILEIDYPLLDKIEFSYTNTKEERVSKKAGRSYLFSERDYMHRNYLFSMKGMNKSGILLFRRTLRKLV